MITDNRIMKDCFVEIRGDEITWIGNEKKNLDHALYEVKDGFICPGLTDVHIHGVNGFDFMDNQEAFTDIANSLPSYGVTSFLATSRTAAEKDVEQFLRRVKIHQNSPSGGANCLGAHLEGPWISPAYSGVQSKSYIRELTWNDVDTIINPYLKNISVITLAPEEVEKHAILNYLQSNGIHISAGHTNASLEEIGGAIDSGLTQITHTFNAMSPVHHRTPGTAAASLYYDDITCEIIADGIHVNPSMIELLYKVKGQEKMILISDCTGYNDLADGEYFFRGKNLVKAGNKVTLKSGQLAGSAITLDKGLKYIVEQCHIPLEQAVYMATQGPLNAIGQGETRGRIAAGYKADIMILNSDLMVERTIVNGKKVYSRDAC
ncbi:N-acetylglucosamine-6-phosphate deacetylase [Gracilibacillus salinarum]|uniref:N-acetylglucosamine-6-phosphate deacetylase n=1 Tax=Gracilibacillus salinarum TaxID=2932255 RepID=A0ABY4GS35_9BACI|nr:N-acetylglucosamine-6-phosphate deacetylase [Gracilibacillus salinarum]